MATNREPFAGSIIALAALLSGPGCVSPARAKNPGAQIEDALTSCTAAKDPLNPLIVEWPATSRTTLEATAQQGLVVVSYSGCTVNVLDGCKATEASVYEVVRVTPAKEDLSIADEGDLKAYLPLGMGSLGGELKREQGIALSYVSVAQRRLAAPPKTLSGQCDGATHYVRAMTVGAYELSTTSKFAAQGGVDLRGVGVSGGGSGARKRLRSSGDVQKCSTAGLSDQDIAASCGAVLQLNLTPIEAFEGKVLAAGFGAGLGALTVIPRVGELREPSPGGGLAEVDVELLKLLQEAKRADRRAGAAWANVIAWDNLARYPGKNPYREPAEQRRDQWRSVDEAEGRFQVQLAAMCARYDRDSQKLRELTAMDDDVVPPRQKEAFRRELAQIYAPRKAELQLCSGPQTSDRPGRMIRLPGGAFEMASNDASKARSVTVAPFWMDVTEVSVAAYKICVDAGSCTQPDGDGKGFCNWNNPDRSDHPINCVDWRQAVDFCAWVKKRLPSDEEWEFAATGGPKKNKYPWGDSEPANQLCWNGRAPRNRTSTCPVGSFLDGNTPTGLKDMAGNVREWTSSERGSGRIFRGGDWASDSEVDVRSAHDAGRRKDDHDSARPSARNFTVGFRCARND